MKSEAVHTQTQLRVGETPASARLKSGSFKTSPNLYVVLMGLSSAVCVYFVGSAFLEKIYADMRGEVADTTSLFMAATILGVVAECFGAAYFYMLRKRSAVKPETKGRRKKQNLGPVFVLGAMLMMLLPIQFSVLSIWLTHKMS